METNLFVRVNKITQILKIFHEHAYGTQDIFHVCSSHHTSNTALHWSHDMREYLFNILIETGVTPWKYKFKIDMSTKEGHHQHHQEMLTLTTSSSLRTRCVCAAILKLEATPHSSLLTPHSSLLTQFPPLSSSHTLEVLLLTALI